MQKASAVIALAGALFCGGCGDYEVPWLSLYPLYQSGDAVLDDLAGTWYSAGSESERIVITTNSDSSRMADEILKDGQWTETEHYDVFLLRLGDSFFLDLSASPQLAVRGHVFLKVWFDQNALQIASLNDEWLRQQVAVQRALPYLDNPDGTPVITAPTLELRRFLLKYAHDADAFESMTVLYRRRSQ